MKKILSIFLNFLSWIRCSLLELDGKNEPPKSATKITTLNSEVMNTMEEIESQFSGTMTVSKDILACRYLGREYSVKEVSLMFNVSETTIRRRQKMLKYRINLVFSMLKEKVGDEYTPNVLLDILEEYYGPKFEFDENGEVDVIV